MRCKATMRGMKEFVENNSDKYQEARDEEFTQQLQDFLSEEGFVKGLIITEDDMQGFIDSFTFTDEADWLVSAYESEIGECADRAYDEAKDEAMGL